MSLARERTEQPVALERIARDQEGGRVPGLSRHAARRERAAAQPLVELPVAERVRARELDALAARLGRQPGPRERGDPEPADERPHAAIVILPGEVLPVP